MAVHGHLSWWTALLPLDIMLRSLPLLALALFAVAASAQTGYDGPIYNGLDDDRADASAAASPGVRIGLGVGPYVYRGPQFSSSFGLFRDDALATNLGVTAEVSFPLSGRLYGRLVGGVLGLGADDDDVNGPANPFLTSPAVLAEADLVYHLSHPRTGALSPYVFSGLSGLFATGDAPDGVETVALAVPIGLGVEYGVTRNLSLFAEASYRFGLTEIGAQSAPGIALAAVGVKSDDVCDASGSVYDLKACKEKGGEPFCGNGGDLPECLDPEVQGNGEAIGDRDRFSSGLFTGGLRLGFGGPPPAPVVPAYVPPAAVAPVVVEAPPAPPAPPVCDLVELNSIYFDYGVGTLDGRARSLLDENVAQLLDNPACCVFIDGFTDTSEGDRFGMGLAGRRAQAVYDYYLSQGVAASRLQIRNRGVAVPSCDKEDPGPGCERNRRVESLPVDCERFQFLLENPSYDPY